MSGNERVFRTGFHLKQGGFTLVELMVALVIGLLLMLAAGQIFLMGLQSFRQVEVLGDKQSALIYAADNIASDIRRARAYRVADNDIENIYFNEDEGRLVILMDTGSSRTTSQCNDLISVHTYRLVEVEGDNFLYYGWACISDTGIDSSSWIDIDYSATYNEEPLVGGFASGGFNVEEDMFVDGSWLISFSLISDRQGAVEQMSFNTVNRTVALRVPGS